MIPGGMVFMATLDGTYMCEFTVRGFARATLKSPADGLTLKFLCPIFWKIRRLWLLRLFERLVIGADFLPRRLV